MSAGGGTSKPGSSLARMGSRLAGRGGSFTVEREKELQVNTHSPHQELQVLQIIFLIFVF